MGHFATHHPGIRTDRNHRQTTAAEDIEISVVMCLVLKVQPLPGLVQGVAVQHGEFADPDQPGPWAGIVAPLGLDMVEQLGQLAVGADFVPHQVRNHFLVGHGQDHIVSGLVLKAAHFSAHLEPAPGFLPDIGRVDHRHGDLLPANCVQLLAQDRLDPIHRPAGQRQVGEQAGCQLADKTSPQQELVAGGFCLHRIFPQSLGEQVRHAHGFFS
jgi:hypothetical protein